MTKTTTTTTTTSDPATRLLRLSRQSRRRPTLSDRLVGQAIISMDCNELFAGQMTVTRNQHIRRVRVTVELSAIREINLRHWPRGSNLIAERRKHHLATTSDRKKHTRPLAAQKVLADLQHGSKCLARRRKRQRRRTGGRGGTTLTN